VTRSLAIAAAILLAADTTPRAAETAAAPEPEHITVQHLLVGFQGSLPGKVVTRTREQAATLANELLEKARKGEDFDAMVKQYTDDAWPGVYSMANKGIAVGGSGEYRREGMVPAFGDVGFKLKVGEYGLAPYDPKTSPYGWHIIKRVK